jgi:hypothetical protein
VITPSKIYAAIGVATIIGVAFIAGQNTARLTPKDQPAAVQSGQVILIRGTVVVTDGRGHVTEYSAR